MGLLEKMGLIEKIPDAVVYDNIEDSYEETYDEETVSVNYNEDCKIDDLIEDVYVQNNLHDKSHSIFKVEELMNSLPKEMVTETKKKSVLSILNNFNLTSDEVFADGEQRKKILASVLDKINTESKLAIEDMQSQIENYKKSIAELEAEINNKNENTRQSNETINIESNRIQELMNFIGGIE